MEQAAVEARRIVADFKARTKEMFNDIEGQSAEEVEQAVYAANAPECCSDAEQAENMLEMLGANIMDDDIYHDEDEHPGFVPSM